jgi:hypothetical protein
MLAGFIPMDDPRLVRRFESLGDLLRNRERVLERDRSLRDPIGERRAFDELEHQRVNTTGIFETVDAADVRMVE